MCSRDLHQIAHTQDSLQTIFFSLEAVLLIKYHGMVPTTLQDGPFTCSKVNSPHITLVEDHLAPNIEFSNFSNAQFVVTMEPTLQGSIRQLAWSDCDNFVASGDTDRCVSVYTQNR